MNNDSYLIPIITIFIIVIVLSTTQFRICGQLHFATLLFIIFLFYMKYERTAFMTSLLYLIVYVQSYKKKELFASSEILPNFSLNKTLNPTDKISESILINNNLPSQIKAWFTGDSFDSSTKDLQWRDLASNNHINFTTPSNVKLTNSSTNNTSGPRKWVSGDTTVQLPIPLSKNDSSITFIHLTRYNPRTSNRGKMWSSENGAWISGYNDNKITVSNTNGTEIVNSGGNKNGDIMNIRGSNWNLFIDQMDIIKQIRSVNVNEDDYIFQNSIQSIPDKVGINIKSDDKTDWDCAEIMIYYRILDSRELDQITNYFNKKYLLKYPAKIEANKYNIYNHFTFDSIPNSDWQQPPQVGSTTSSGNKLLGITDSEYECVSLCDKNTPSCAAFSYHMEKGACYLVDEKNILNHTKPNKATLSGTNKVRQDIAQKAKEEADRKAKEEVERKAREEVERKEQEAAAASEAERQRQFAVVESEQLQQQKLLLAKDRFIPIFNKDSNDVMGSDGVYKIDIRNGNVYPCYNISTSGYINGGAYGSLLDNNDTTGVDIEKYFDRTLPYEIVITLPVEKSFQGVFSMRLITPWTSKLPRRVSLATYNSNAFSQNWWINPQQQNNQFRIEQMDLGEVGGWGNGPYNHSWNVNFSRPFKYIALLIHSGWTQDGYASGQAGAIWITSLNFISTTLTTWKITTYNGIYGGTSEPTQEGLTDDFWDRPNSVWGSLHGFGNYIEVDFGNIKYINQIIVGPIAQHYGGWGWPYINGAALQYSVDGNTWSTITSNINQTNTSLMTISYNANISSRYFRIIYLDGRLSWLGIGTFKFTFN